ncbi:MAG TPA: 16S rRNA (guanine(527)-N(7))-methyltransferase RsmG [Alphaproteobacteria bacterium]|nr:16S rRNA (guanine(527)-N(7))-methyltransferase RsmG [Alphaproteobacteria bacterium]
MQPQLNFDKPSQKVLLDKYVSELLKWNKTHNLIGKTTEETVLNRHIEDSLQIKNFFKKEDKIIYDFGSGAGLPAIPLAVAFLSEDLEKKFHLFESNTKKASFLQNIIAKLKLENALVRNERIEVSKGEIKPDIITARAFSSLVEIFDIAKPLMQPETKFILHKGLSAVNEVAEAKKKYNFEYKLHQSKCGDGFILECCALSAI